MMLTKTPPIIALLHLISSDSMMVALLTIYTLHTLDRFSLY